MGAAVFWPPARSSRMGVAWPGSSVTIAPSFGSRAASSTSLRLIADVEASARKLAAGSGDGVSVLRPPFAAFALRGDSAASFGSRSASSDSLAPSSAVDEPRCTGGLRGTRLAAGLRAGDSAAELGASPEPSSSESELLEELELSALGAGGGGSAAPVAYPGGGMPAETPSWLS